MIVHVLSCVFGNFIRVSNPEDNIESLQRVLGNN